VSIYWRQGLCGAGENNMNLNDELGSFSKRREVEVVAKKRKSHDEDDYEYDEWDDDEYDDSDDESYGDYDFKMYKLDELKKFNEEEIELDELISPWWKNLKIIFKKSTFSKIGIIEYKKKSLLDDDSFEDVFIDDIEESLEELKIFEKSLQKSYSKRFKSNIYGIVFYILLASWIGGSMFWYFLVGWSLYDMVKYYFKYSKEKEWLTKAERYITSQDKNNIESKKEDSNGRLDDVLAFNAFISKEENNHWSIKLYDSIANLFTRKK